MEISNEIKAKVFAQYLGQSLYVHIEEVGTTKVIGKRPFIGVKMFKNGRWWCFSAARERVVIDYCSLILRPLSEITDEDAIEICKMVVHNHVKYPSSDYRVKRLKPIAVNGHPVIEVVIDNDWYNETVRIGTGTGTVWIPFKPDTRIPPTVYQYMTIKGYDVPHVLLDGKTLHETGLAIYKQI